MQPRISFVILHYLATQDTIECIESIFTNVKYDNFQVIVVDNGSRNLKDIEILETYSKKYERMELVVLKENLGFARGNNKGFQIAKRKYHSDFIVLLNNDTIIDQSDFCQTIVSKFKETNFAVAGPLIVTKDGLTTSNPIQPGQYKIYRQILGKFYTVLCLLLSYIGLDEKFLKKTRNLKKKEINSPQETNLPQETKDIMNYKLHGCCLIFSKEYIERFEGLNPNTFLYMEEDILYIRLRNNQLTSLFTPKLRIYHKEDAATNKIVHSNIEKRRFIYKNHIHSYNALIGEINRKQ